MSEIHDKLRKLLALAEQGIGGEKLHARSTLEKLMKKHGVTFDDLVSEQKTLQWFKPGKHPLERKLLYQVIAAVCGKLESYTSKALKDQIGHYVTRSEQLEINLRYPIYLAAFQEELEICYTAFVHKNDIFNSDAPSSNSKRSEEELMRIAIAMFGMSKVPIHRTLTNAQAD